MPGYTVIDPNFLDNTLINGLFTCNICYDFYDDPVRPIDCCHLLCFRCAASTEGHRCPFCRTDYSMHELNSNTLDPNFIATYDQFKIECDGCKEQMARGRWNKHVEECEAAMIANGGVSAQQDYENPIHDDIESDEERTFEDLLDHAPIEQQHPRLLRSDDDRPIATITNGGVSAQQDYENMTDLWVTLQNQQPVPSISIHDDIKSDEERSFEEILDAPVEQQHPPLLRSAFRPVEMNRYGIVLSLRSWLDQGRLVARPMEMPPPIRLGYEVALSLAQQSAGTTYNTLLVLGAIIHRMRHGIVPYEITSSPARRDVFEFVHVNATYARHRVVNWAEQHTGHFGQIPIDSSNGDPCTSSCLGACEANIRYIISKLPRIPYNFGTIRIILSVYTPPARDPLQFLVFIDRVDIEIHSLTRTDSGVPGYIIGPALPRAEHHSPRRPPPAPSPSQSAGPQLLLTYSPPSLPSSSSAHAPQAVAGAGTSDAAWIMNRLIQTQQMHFVATPGVRSSSAPRLPANYPRHLIHQAVELRASPPLIMYRNPTPPPRPIRQWTETAFEIYEEAHYEGTRCKPGSDVIHLHPMDARYAQYAYITTTSGTGRGVSSSTQCAGIGPPM